MDQSWISACKVCLGTPAAFSPGAQLERVSALVIILPQKRKSWGAEGTTGLAGSAVSNIGSISFQRNPPLVYWVFVLGVIISAEQGTQSTARDQAAPVECEVSVRFGAIALALSPGQLWGP